MWEMGLWPFATLMTPWSIPGDQAQLRISWGCAVMRLQCYFASMYHTTVNLLAASTLKQSQSAEHIPLPSQSSTIYYHLFQVIVARWRCSSRTARGAYSIYYTRNEKDCHCQSAIVSAIKAIFKHIFEQLLCTLLQGFMIIVWELFVKVILLTGKQKQVTWVCD